MESKNSPAEAAVADSAKFLYRKSPKKTKYQAKGLVPPLINSEIVSTFP